MSTLGRNIAFPIYKGDGTSFHNLVMKKSTSDSIVMSLGDKVTGDVYYKDNTLECNMDEYILVDGVKYSIVNPPTIVREGLKSENGDLKGMTKYSFEFYHPMYMLGNMAFSDVAVTNSEAMFKSHDRTFSWIGNLTDYVAKLNKNLQDTQFIVSISSSIDADSRKVLSDVLSFTNNTIADALKTAYDTWHFPFVVDAIKSDEQYYNQGKRFLIQFGNPTREILDSNNQPFVFHFGKGVGLKNNSRTPRNNKIVTRVSGYGSEQNIPYGYPQIPWTGDHSATQTADGYPIYEGIVGGVVTKLIKHPFTRTHLMPSVYVESVRKKVDSAAPDYDNTIELIDYYDAPSTYPNPINLDAPKYDIVRIDSIKPELGDMTIVGAEPVNDDLTPASGWDDTMDDDGKYKQSYFKLTIPQLDFDVYACASITEEMKINMRSGACIGCTFDVQVDWDDYRENFFDEDGNFLPDGEQRDLNKYPKSNLGNITLVCKKDINTFGTLMPNVYQYPRSNDKFVILGISLPNTYITNAQVRLDDAMMAHMLDNNVYYYDYPLKFDEDFLLNNTNILSQIRTNTVLRFMFGNLEKSLYVKQITIKYGEGVLPKYDITLTDNIEVVLNQIGLVADDVSRLAMAMMQMNKRTNINITNTESLQRYVDYTIMPNLESLQKQIDGSQVTYFGNENPFDASQPYSDGKYVVDPTKFPASEWDDDYSEHDGDMFYNRDSGKGYEFTIIDNSTSPVVYGWQLIQDEDIIQALTNAQNAQDTADGKRRVFICDASHHTPNPPYDVGDLWVNVKYPYATGATYDDEILKCVVAKTEDQTFDISDWSLANGYTAALRNFINGTYADDLQDIQNQIDGKAETWYQNTDPSTAWTTTALKNQHKGDIWHNSSTSTINGVKAGQDAIWNGTAWVVDETVPQAIYDEIDGKCAIYVAWGAWGNDLQEKDLFIPAANTTQGGVTYKANKVYRCVDKDTPTFQEIAYTDDTQYNGFITKLIGSSGQTKDAAENAIAAIKHALSDGNTYNEGGLILSNLISLGTGSPTSGTFTPWAGISGIYKTSETGTGYKGHGIAAWFGGGMIDKEVSAVANAAKSLFRFDGSGYVASGNLKWDASGNVTIQGYSINATTLQVGGSNVATQAMLDNFVSKAFFNRLFTAYDANGNAIVPNDTTTAISNLKILVGTWTEQYLSALGLNSEGGGGGTGDVSHIKIGTNPDVFLDPDEDGIIDMSSYAANWNDAYNKRHTHSNKSVLDGITSTKVSHWDAVYGVVPSAAYESGNQLADKNFVNSSISTATATYISNNGVPFNSLAELQAYTGQHDKNDYAFVKTTDSAGNTLYNRYKFDGTSWSLEYTLNNSSFTADQWSAINSGITSSLVSKLNGIAAGAQVNVLESVKINGTALSISSKAVNIVTGNGLQSSSNTISVLLPSNSGLSVASTGLKLDIVNDLNTSSAYRAISATQAKKIWDLLNQMFTLEGDGTSASPYVIKANYGLYSEQFLSALGQNSQGGSGGGDFDEEQMWTALQSTSGTYATTKIATSHIPDISSTYGYAKASQLGNYLPLSGGTLTGAGLTIATGADNKLIINNTDTETKYSLISFRQNGTEYGSLGTLGTDNLTWNGNILLHSANSSVSKSGETLTVKINGTSQSLTNTNTTYSAGTGISLSGTTFSNSGVRATTINGNYLRVNTNGTNADLTIPYATSSGKSFGVNTNNNATTFIHKNIISSGASYKYHVILLVAVQRTADQSAYNNIDGRFFLYKTGGNVYDVVDVNINQVYNALEYHLEYYGQNREYKLCRCKYNNIEYYALYCPYHANPFTNVIFTGACRSDWDSNSLSLPKDIVYKTAAYSGNPEVIDNSEVNNSLTFTLTTSVITYAINRARYFPSGIMGNASTATKLHTPRSIWGQSFDGSANVSGNMTSVGSITPSANGNALGTTSARFNIYGTSGNYSSTLIVADAITLSGTTAAKKRIYFGDTSHYIELDSTGFHFSHGVYSDSFISALGSNSSGGGSGGIDIEAMWAELQGNTGTYANAKINVNHIPDISSTYGYAKASQLGNYLPLSGGTMTGTLTGTNGNFSGNLTVADGKHILINQDAGDSKTGYISVGGGYTANSGKYGVKVLAYDQTDAQTGLGQDLAMGSGWNTNYNFCLVGGTNTSGVGHISFVTHPVDSKSYTYLGGFRNNNGSVEFRVLGTLQATGATTLGSTLSVSGATTLTGLLTANGGIVVPSGKTAKLGDCTIEWDSVNWGALAGSSYTPLMQLNSPKMPDTSGDYGSLYICAQEDEHSYSGGTAMFMQIDGFFYQKGGSYRVLDTSDTRVTSVATGTGLTGGTITSTGTISINSTYQTYISHGESAYNNLVNYLPLTGGVIKNGTSVNPLNIDGNGASTYLYFRNGGTDKTSVGWRNGISYVANEVASGYPRIGVTDAGNPEFWTNSASNKYAIHTSRDGAKFGGSIEIFSDGTDWTEGVRMHLATDKWCGVVMCGSDNTGSSGTSAKTWSMHNNDGSFYIAQNGSNTFTNGISCVSGTWAILSSGNVGIGNTSPSQKLHVTGNILASGEVTASSDERLKTIVGDGNLDLRYIANAPNILFKWNNGQDDKVHGGSLAQYYLTNDVAKHYVGGSEDTTYSLNYGALGVSMAISIAKKVVNHEERIVQLEKENKELREQLKRA